MGFSKCKLLVLLGLALMLACSPAFSADCPGFQGPDGGLTVRVYRSNVGPHMEFSKNDGGSGARRDLSVFKPKEGYWFGHSAVETSDSNNFPKTAYKVEYNGDIHAPGSPIAKPVGWNRIWGLQRCSDRTRVYGLWCPQARSGYIALGCIFRQTDCDHVWADQPPPELEVDMLVTLRADLAAPAKSTGSVWNDHGSGAQDDGSVYTLEANAECGVGLDLMLAQAGYDDYGNAEAFGVLNFNAMDVRLQP